jgi:hypothetical protein
MLKYHLVDNLLAKQTDKYKAQTRTSGSCDKAEFIKRLLSKGTLITQTDVLAVFNAIENTAVELLQQGYTLNFPLFNTSFSISGTFESPLDSFDPERHKLNINITKGSLLRDIEKTVPFEKMNASASGPRIREVKDIVSGEINRQLTPGGVIEIRGNNIKLSGNDAECGVWFVPETDTPKKAEIIATNKPSVVLAMVPALPAGPYKLKIVTRYSGARDWKTPKAFVFSAGFVVN